MGPTIIARNYAETLLALARRQGGGAVEVPVRVVGREQQQFVRAEMLEQALDLPRRGRAVERL